MPNINVQSGLAPVRYLTGSPWNGALNYYCVLAANTNQLFIGDPVTTIGVPGGDSQGYPTVTLATAGAAVRGVIVAIGTSAGGGGPYINPNNLNICYRPAGAQPMNYYLGVCDDPDVLYEIQEAGAGAVLTAAAVSRNVNFNTGTRPITAPIPVYSPTYLDNNTVAGTATLNLKIHQAINRNDNTIGQAYQKWLVKINNHEYNSGTASS